MNFRFILGYVAICLTYFETFAAGGKSTGPGSVPVTPLPLHITSTGGVAIQATEETHIQPYGTTSCTPISCATGKPGEHHIVYCQGGGEQKNSITLPGTVDTQHLAALTPA